MVLAKSSTSPGRIFIYANNGNGVGTGTVYEIKQYDLPATLPLTSGTWTTNSPPTTVPSYLGDKLLVPAVLGGTPVPAGLATLPGSGGNDEVFARFWDTSGLYPANVVIMRWQNGVGWSEVSGFDLPPNIGERTDYPPLIFKNVGGTLYYGYDHSGTPGINKMLVWRYTPNTTTTSCWVSTKFPSAITFPVGGNSGFVRITSFDATQGTSGAVYVPLYNGSATSPTCVLMEMQHTGGGSGTSGCVITHAVPGDVYNIGGVSSEPTTHIEFTLWENSAYSSRGKTR